MPAAACRCLRPGLLSWFASPYILRLSLGPDDVAAVTTLTLLAQPRTSHIRLSEMREPQTLRPLATFAAQGRIFFIDGNIADAALLARLGLQKKPQATAMEQGYDTDDEDEEPGKAKK